MRSLRLLVITGLIGVSSAASADPPAALVQGGDLAVTMHEGKPHVFYVGTSRVVKHMVLDGRWKFLADVVPSTNFRWSKFGATFEGNVLLAATSVPNVDGPMIVLAVLAKIGGTHISKDGYVIRQFDVFSNRIALRNDELCHNINSNTMTDEWRGLSMYQGAERPHMGCVHKNFAFDYFWNKHPDNGFAQYSWSYVDYHRLDGFRGEAMGPGTGWSLGGGDHYVYRNKDNDLVEFTGPHTLYVKNHNISEQAGKAKQAVGDPVGWAAGNTQHVAYEAKDRAIHELWWDGSWHFTDITKEAAAPANVAGPLAAHVLGGSQHVFYRSIDQHIRELVWTPEKKKWEHRDIWAAARGRVLAQHKKVVSYLQGNSQHVLYLGADGNVHELFHDGTAWKTNNLTTEAARP